MTRDLKTQYGYAYSLHREGEDSNIGFGYAASQKESVNETMKNWNSHTPDNCAMKGVKCQMCEFIGSGGKYVVTEL